MRSFIETGLITKKYPKSIRSPFEWDHLCTEFAIVNAEIKLFIMK